MPTRYLFAFSLACFALLALADPAHATPPQVEVVPVDPLPEQPPEPAADGRVVATVGIWGAGFHLSDLTFLLKEPEVAAAVDGVLSVPGRVNVGGYTLGVGYRPTSWLRLPEVRLRIGGGQTDGVPTVLGGANTSGIEGRSIRHFVGTIEVVAGFEHRLGRVTPFLRGYVAAGFVTVRTDLTHPELGALGAERASRGWVGAGVEAGFIVHVNEVLGLHLAYRGGLYGPESHGVTLGLAILGRK